MYQGQRLVWRACAIDLHLFSLIFFPPKESVIEPGEFRVQGDWLGSELSARDAVCTSPALGCRQVAPGAAFLPGSGNLHSGPYAYVSISPTALSLSFFVACSSFYVLATLVRFFRFSAYVCKQRSKYPKVFCHYIILDYLLT